MNNRLNKSWMLPAALVSAMALTGCGGSAVEETTIVEQVAPVAVELGDVAISMTDAPGDFATYTVDVTSLLLIKANGDEVETLPLTSRIDFAQYTQLSEFMAVSSIPSGKYVSAKMLVNYADADIKLENESGQLVSAQPLDSEGQAITEMVVELSFSQDRPVNVTKGKLAFLMIDFDIAASNTVLSYEPAQIQVEPFLLSDLEFDQAREHRARGLLQSVDSDNSQFTLNLLPFQHRNRQFGEATLQSNDETLYEVDGISFQGEAGILALSEAQGELPVIVTGQVSDSQLMATQVYAGSSVPWSNTDALRGTIIARTGDSITVRGHHIERTTGEAIFNSDLTLLVGDLTQVTQLPLNENLQDQTALSVGQRIVAFGDLNVTDGHYTLDSHEGNVRMLLTQIKGLVDVDAPLALDLHSIGGRDVSIFDFSGTGASSELDADPSHYEIDTQDLALSSLIEGDILQVRGMVNSFGMAPSDFIANSLTKKNGEHHIAKLAVSWEQQTSAIESTGDNTITISLLESRNILRVAGITIALEQPQSLTIKPLADDHQGKFVIAQRGDATLTAYRDFNDYTAALNALLAQDYYLQKLTSKGKYDSETGELSVSSMTTLLVSVQ